MNTVNMNVVDLTGKVTKQELFDESTGKIKSSLIPGGGGGSTTLDTPLVDGKQYVLGSISSLALTLPTTGTYQSYIWVVFSASAAFTPTITGTYVGETAGATVASKTYEYLFTWNGTSWVLSILYY